MTVWRVPINIAYPGTGGPGVNVWHIRTIELGPGTTETGQVNALLGYIRTFYNTIGSWYPATTVLSLGTVTAVDSSREIAGTFAGVTGTGTGSAPQLLALVNTWKTTIAARRGRGRTFLGPLCTAAMQNDGTPAAALLSDVAAASSALLTSSLGYGNGAIGVYGYDQPKLAGKANLRDPTDAKVFRDITGYKARDLFASLRSRRD
jgi:hypothetical protein